MKRECSFIVAAAGIVSLWLSTQPVRADLMNGTFDTGLSGWSITSGIVQHALAGGDGKARFVQDDNNFDPSSTLSQPFTLNPGSLTLSFERQMQSIFVGGETDTFTASLLDSIGNPLVAIAGETHFYSLDSAGAEHTAATGVSVFGNTVSLDVSSWANSNVTLVFSLAHDYTDALQTSVLVDNVAVSVVPVPGAGVLAGLGLGLAGWRLRRRD